MSNIAFRLLLTLYNVILWVIFLLYILYLLITLQFKRFLGLWGNHFAFTYLHSSKLKTTHTIWIHAASIGESLLAFEIVKALSLELPKYVFVITTCTKSSGDLWRTHFPDKVFHLLLPWDIRFIVKRFIKILAPKLTIFMESDFWPNYLFTLKQNNIPVILLNGRMSDRSYQRWRLIKFFTKNMLATFNYIAVDSLNSAYNLQPFLGPSQELQFLGNLKHMLPTTYKLDDHISHYLEQVTEARTVFLSVSTHWYEEKMLLQLHNELRPIIPNLLTIIIPRHLKKVDKLLRYAKKFNLNLRQYNQLNMLPYDTDVFVVDVFGKSYMFFSLAEIVYIGKSMFKQAQGGHNLLEPLKRGIPVIFGPYMNNFAEISQDAIAAGAAIKVANSEELQNVLATLLQHPEKLHLMGECAHKFTSQYDNIKEKIISKIKSYI